MKKPTVCPACTSHAIRQRKLTTTLDNKYLGNFFCYQCLSCKNFFTYPFPKSDKNHLSPDIPIDQYSTLKRKLLQFFADRRVNLTKKVLKEKSLKDTNLLDIGAGACVYANATASKGFNVIAVEPNKKNLQFAGPKINFINGYFGKAIYRKIKQLLKNKKVDVITMWHVLEHCPDPNEIFDLSHKLLNDKGNIVIAVPNINSLQSKLGGNYWTYLDIPHHLYHFTEEGLDFVARRNGFTRSHYFSFSLEYEIFGWQQTLLNLFTRSHNFFYNKSKKNRIIKVKFPTWTKLLTSLQILLLPSSLLLALLSWLFDMPSCLVVAYEKK